MAELMRLYIRKVVVLKLVITKQVLYNNALKKQTGFKDFIPITYRNWNVAGTASLGAAVGGGRDRARLWGGGPGVGGRVGHAGLAGAIVGVITS